MMTSTRLTAKIYVICCKKHNGSCRDISEILRDTRDSVGPDYFWSWRLWFFFFFSCVDVNSRHVGIHCASLRLWLCRHLVWIRYFRYSLVYFYLIINYFLLFLLIYSYILLIYHRLKEVDSSFCLSCFRFFVWPAPNVS